MKFNQFNVPAYPVDIREWGCVKRNDDTGEEIRYEKCYIRALTVKEFAEFLTLSSKKEADGYDLSMAHVAVRFALEDAAAGKPLFTLADLQDIANNNIRPCRRIMDKLCELNSMSKDEAETLEKN